jgi:predicted nucleotidyltransferase component of viral defense system
MPPKAPTDFGKVRTIAIIAMFSVDVLFDKVVLKGGNALTLVYGMSSRTSLDLDFSIENDFEDFDDIQRRVFDALKDRYAAEGYTVFDLKFEKKPAVPRQGQSPRWGGYMISFKLMERTKYDTLGGNVDAARRDALVVGPDQRRTFTIDLSKFEYTAGKKEAQIDEFAIYVYTPEMIVIEKIRAICQQMPEYGQRGYTTPRARDFFDIHLVLSKIKLDLSTARNLELARCIFAAKEVPLSLIAEIPTQREFHRQDWESVRASTAEAVKEFDYYFDYVVEQTKLLQALWKK